MIWLRLVSPPITPMWTVRVVSCRIVGRGEWGVEGGRGRDGLQPLGKTFATQTRIGSHGNSLPSCPYLSSSITSPFSHHLLISSSSSVLQLILILSLSLSPSSSSVPSLGLFAVYAPPRLFTQAAGFIFFSVFFSKMPTQFPLFCFNRYVFLLFNSTFLPTWS